MAAVGECYPVAVPPACALRSEYGVQHVLYARPPNLNPARPDCVPGEASLRTPPLGAASPRDPLSLYRSVAMDN